MRHLDPRLWRFLSSVFGLAILWSDSACGEPTDYGHIIGLPPFIVEDQAVPLHWRYAAFDKFEILSLCSTDATQGFAQQISYLEQELSWILPPEFRVRKSLPTTYILCDESMRKRLDRDIPVEAFTGMREKSKLEAAPSSQKMTYVTMPQLGLQDDDEDMSFMLADNQFFDDGQMVYLPSAMESLLEQRTPPLPIWFISGFMSLYGTMTFNRNVMAGLHLEALHVSVPRFLWISSQESLLVRQMVHDERMLNENLSRDGVILSDDPESASGSPFLPMTDLLVAPHPPKQSGAADLYRRAWLGQAALFVRWGIDDDKSNRRESFWKFLRRASTEPVTEKMFKDCLGLSYEQMISQLRAYLPTALYGPANVGIRAQDVVPVAVRDASPAEVGRIMGDWERLEAAVEKQAYPGLSGAYLEHARHTLWHDYDHGDRDPRLLAAMGLYECDLGDDRAALPLLTAAVAAQVIRPKAYFELARILYAQALAKPAGAKGQLSAAQTASILTPLMAGGKQSPPLSQAGELFADVWFHSDLTPSPSDLAELEEETVLFPKSVRLVLQTAVLDARAGFTERANQIINRGLENAPDEPSKARLVQFRASLIGSK